MDWERREIFVEKVIKMLYRTDFVMKLLAMVEAGQLTRYQEMVQRQVDMKSK